MKLLILDFDGTLADTVPHVINCIMKCIKKFNLKELEYDDILRFNGAVLKDVLISLGAKKEQLLEIKEYYSKIFLEDLSDIKLYPHVYETLKELKGNIKISIATNRARNTLIPLLKYLNIYDFIDFIVCENDVKNKKPSTDMVDMIKNEFKISENEILVIGDTNLDVIMGKNSNCKTCGIYYDEMPSIKLVESNPEYLINDISKLFEILNK